MKKSVIGIAVVVLLLIVGGIAWAIRSAGSNGQGEPTPAPTPPPEKFNELPVTERPYVRMVPNESKRVPRSKGYNFALTIHDLKKPGVTDAEYEVTYRSGDALQGAYGKIKLAELPDEYDIFMGTCSAGGKCAYHEGVASGELIIRSKKPEKYALKNSWAHLANTDKSTKISSTDGKFVAEGNGFISNPFTIVLQSPGYPENPTQTVVSQVYSVGTFSPIKGAVKVSIRLNTEATAENVVMLAWDGEEYVELPATITDRVATVNSPQLYEAYLVVTKE